MRPNLILVAALAVATSAHAAPRARAQAADTPRLPVTTFKLPNGLTVLVSEDHSVPLVAVDVWYHVGSKDEVPGRTGFAHLFEHLMFKGSAHVADGEHFRLVTETGGTLNATTNRDRTNFFETVPSNFLERALFLESDRMGFLLDTMTQEKLDNQRDVVRNERRQRYENVPYGMVSLAMDEALFPDGHPYHHATIGDHKDLEAATLDDVKDFFRTWYTPSNATLALVGDVTLADARRLVTKWFGELPRRPVPQHKATPPVKLAAAKDLHLDDKVALDRVYLAWLSPAEFAPGDAELDLLATVLTSRTGRLYERLVHHDQIAQRVGASQGSGRLAGSFDITVTARPGHHAAEVQKIVDEELANLLGAQPVTEEELARARTQMEAAFVYGLESAFGRADRLDEYYDRFGRADMLDKDMKRYRDATVASVMKAARQVLSPARVVITVTPAARGGK